MQKNKLHRLSRSRFYHRVSDNAIAKKLVGIVQEFSKSKESGNRIGSNCMVTFLSPKTNLHEFRYYDEHGAAPKAYGPHFVSEGCSFKGLVINAPESKIKS